MKKVLSYIMSNKLRSLGFALLIYWMFSFFVCWLDFKAGRLDIVWLMVYWCIDLLTLWFIYNTAIFKWRKSLSNLTFGIGYVLIAWFVGYSIFTDFLSFATELWLRLCYGAIDVLTYVYIQYVLRDAEIEENRQSIRDFISDILKDTYAKAAIIKRLIWNN